MKKRWSAILCALTVCFSLSACGKQTTVNNSKDANVYPASTNEDSVAVAMGDVMPFYDDGVMNIYHLRDSKGSNSMFYHPIARLTTTDYVHYKDEGVALNFEEDITSIDAALGTGSFIKDATTGVYHCFYTGHNDSGETGFAHTEVIRHATSNDNQATWVKDEEFNLEGWENDFRDPYVYWDNTDSCYYMLITTRDYGNAVIKRYTATTLSAKSEEWTFRDNFFTNDEGSYNMECPSYFELNGYYYLAYSEQGDNRVTHYRYRTCTNGEYSEWKRFERDAIDNFGFYAGRLEKAGDKLFAFAWCARLTGGMTGGFDWAGNLITHELKQADNGELLPVMPSTFADTFKNKQTYETVSGSKVKNFTFEGDKFAGYTVKELSANVTRMHFKISAENMNGNFGLSFGLDSPYNNRLGSAVIAFDYANGKIVCYNNVSSILRYGAPLTSVAYAFETGKSYDVDVVIDGEIVVVYVANEVALTSRLPDMPQNGFAFYSNGAKAKIQEIAFYE